MPTFSKGAPHLVAAAAESGSLQLARRLQSREARGICAATQEAVMGKYVLAWFLGVPLFVLVAIYFVSNAAC